MNHRPLVIFAGRRSFSIPFGVYALAFVVLGAACLLTLANAVFPGLVGVAPLLPVPAAVQTLANVLAYLVAFAGLIALVVLLLGLQESVLAARRFGAYERLFTLQELLTAGIVIAPNLPEDRQAQLVANLRQLVERGGASAILGPATAGDIADRSVDRLFIATALGAADFRRQVRGLKWDDIACVPARHARRIAKEANLGSGTLWLMTWD